MKKAVALILALLLCSTMILFASADAFIPADDNCNYYLLSSIYSDDDCYAVNIFLSNYAETQLTYYEVGSGDGDAYAALLKHFELNPKAYKEGTVTSFVGDDGMTYMRVDSDRFEDRMEDLFSIDIDAEDWPGYRDGGIVVSAENFGAPILVYASADYCDYLGDYLYKVGFSIYKYNGNVGRKYGIANRNLDSGDGEIIATGYAQFYYYGSPNETEFHVYDFTLAQYIINEGSQRSPYGNKNEPYAEPVVETTTAPAESASTQEPAEEMHSEENTAQSANQETVPAETDSTETPTEENIKEDLEPPAGKARISLALILSLGVVAIVMMTMIPLVVILILFRRKKP